MDQQSSWIELQTLVLKYYGKVQAIFQTPYPFPKPCHAKVFITEHLAKLQYFFKRLGKTFCESYNWSPTEAFIRLLLSVQ